MPRFPSAQGRLNHEPGFHLSCDEHLSEGWGPPLMATRKRTNRLTRLNRAARRRNERAIDPPGAGMELPHYSQPVGRSRLSLLI